jgi:hypothetical protein
MNDNYLNKMTLALKIIKKTLKECIAQSARDLEQEINLLKMRHEYRQAQFESLLRVCEHSLKKLENQSVSQVSEIVPE